MDIPLASSERRDAAGISAWLDVNVRGWQFASLIIAAVAVIPILVIASSLLSPADEIWRHLAQTLLTELVRNTLVLLVGVGVIAFVLGVGFAWLVAMCDFPGRKFFEWALMLPLAVPAYVLAFVTVGLFDFSGPVQEWLRARWGADRYWFPPVRSVGGLMIVMGLAFYPYVYMLARAAFMTQGRRMFEVGRLLGLAPWAAFWRVAIPLARPAIAAGMALALMETLADFGTVAVFNYDTFTTAIYKAWFALFSLEAAAQLSSILLVLVALALIMERTLRRGARYYVAGKADRELRYKLTRGRALLASAAAALTLILAFVLPVIQLLLWALESTADTDARYFRFLANTLGLGMSAAAVTTAGALLLAYTHRLKPDRRMVLTVRLATLGYALPGSVLAVGMMMTVVWIDGHLAAFIHGTSGIAVGPILTGSLVILVAAYAVRFLAVAYGPVDSAFERIRPSLWQAARSLGAGNREILWRISIPMLRPGLVSAALLVLVEVMKEMPATLLLRPFGWDTLATRVFEWTSEGQWQAAALPALTLILIGLLPVFILIRRAPRRDRAWRPAGAGI